MSETLQLADILVYIGSSSLWFLMYLANQPLVLIYPLTRAISDEIWCGTKSYYISVY